jgi:hypothetical protein
MRPCHVLESIHTYVCVDTFPTIVVAFCRQSWYECWYVWVLPGFAGFPGFFDPRAWPNIESRGDTCSMLKHMAAQGVARLGRGRPCEGRICVAVGGGLENHNVACYYSVLDQAVLHGKGSPCPQAVAMTMCPCTCTCTCTMKACTTVRPAPTRLPMSPSPSLRLRRKPEGSHACTLMLTHMPPSPPCPSLSCRPTRA